MNLNNGGNMSENKDTSWAKDLILKDDWFKLTPEEQTQFDDLQFQHALSQCGGLGLEIGGSLFSEANQKYFIKSEFYVQKANKLRSSDPEELKSFLKDPRKYAEEHWEKPFEKYWEEVKKL